MERYKEGFAPVTNRPEPSPMALMGFGETSDSWPLQWFADDDDDGGDDDSSDDSGGDDSSSDDSWDDTAADEQSEDSDDRGSDPEPVQR